MRANTANMTLRILLLAATAALLSGCHKKSETPPMSKAEATAEAIRVASTPFSIGNVTTDQMNAAAPAAKGHKK